MRSLHRGLRLILKLAGLGTIQELICLQSMDDSSVYLNGNVDLLVSHKFPEEQKQLDTIGANLFIR